ncbi:Protein shisa-4 Transmembrane protein 58 Precursor [Channa argus]|uniref:Protein shisa-5 n=1 Tax=Channa argus TaxID=215402 RepID=A0A6G1PIG9_CHAAH|nr:Protein shisa-4 Transmembrane protein 58 Precursor [Channa argus]
MASGLPSVVLLVFFVVLSSHVSAWDDDCKAYTYNTYHHAQKCSYGRFCCGSCTNRYCCTSGVLRLTEDEQDNCESFEFTRYPSVPLIFGIVTCIIALLVFICCCVCPCCCLYKMCRKPRPVMAPTTHTTVVTSTTQHYPRQPTATPVHPLGYQYPPYQATPMQPGYGTQPMPHSSVAQPMPPVPYQGQPYVPGPLPTYQEATGPAYPPNPMPYSKAAFAPGQTPYPIQPVVHPNAPTPHTDYLAQPAYNPDYVGS